MCIERKQKYMCIKSTRQLDVHVHIWGFDKPFPPFNYHELPTKIGIHVHSVLKWLTTWKKMRIISLSLVEYLHFYTVTIFWWQDDYVPELALTSASGRTIYWYSNWNTTLQYKHSSLLWQQVASSDNLHDATRGSLRPPTLAPFV